MRALVLDNQTVRYAAEMAVPAMKPGDALLKVRLAGICNTDLELAKGYMGFAGVLGHEFVADVVDVADEDHRHWVGQRVCVDINAACQQASSVNQCAICGHPHHCPNRTVIGIDRHHGAFADYVVAPVRNLFAVPPEVSDTQAVFTEPLAAAFEITDQLTITSAQSVVVLGDGKLGLLIAQALRLATPHVTLIGRHAGKLALVERLGVQTEAVARGEQPRRVAAKSVDVVVEATGSAAGLETAMQLVRPRGTIVLKSTVATGTDLNLAPIVIDEITVVGSRCGPFDQALNALAARRVQVDSMVQAVYPIDQGEQAMAHAAQKGTLKVLLSF